MFVTFATSYNLWNSKTFFFFFLWTTCNQMLCVCFSLKKGNVMKVEFFFFFLVCILCVRNHCCRLKFEVLKSSDNFMLG